MQTLARVLAGLVPVAWTVAAAAYLLVFLRRDPAAERWCRRLAFAAAFAHALLFVAVAAAGHPLIRSAGTVLFAVGLSIMVVHLYLETRLLAHLAAQRLLQRLTRVGVAAGQLPAAHIGTHHEQDLPLAGLSVAQDRPVDHHHGPRARAHQPPPCRARPVGQQRQQANHPPRQGLSPRSC